MPTYADVAATVLSDAGIEYIFGVPGSLSSVELIEAASRKGIRYILCSNESSAAVMAGTYGIMTGRPGVCSTGVGPGAAASVLGVANNWLERSPCLILTDRYGDAQFRRHQRQRLDQDRLLQPITKGSFKLAADSAAVTMRRAIALATSGRPGPVHVDMPYDVMLAEASPEAFPPSIQSESHIARGCDNHPGLEAAVREITKAQRPVVIIGLQVNRSGQETNRAFIPFAENLGAPVFASLASKGTLPENHPLSMGTFRGAEDEKDFFESADLLITVGFDPVELFGPGYWDHPQPVVSLDEVPHLDDLIRPRIEVVGNLADSLRILAKLVSPCQGWNSEFLDSFRNQRRSALYPSGKGLMPGAVIRIAREILPDNGIMTADAGSHKVLASDIWEVRRPLGFLTSSGLGSMAVALPAGMAAKLVEPATPVICLTGDGGFLMRLGDLETAVREKLPIVVVIFNDGYLNLIKMKQDTRSFTRQGTGFGSSDYVSASKALGFEAVRVESEESLKNSLKMAMKSGGPWVIDAVINPDGYIVSENVRPE